MHCPQCHTPHSSEVVICDHCGAELPTTGGVKRGTLIENGPAAAPWGISSPFASPVPSSPPPIGPGVYQPSPDSKRHTVVERDNGPVGDSPFADPFGAALRPPAAGGLPRADLPRDLFERAMSGGGVAGADPFAAQGKRRTVIDVGESAASQRGAAVAASGADRRVIGWLVSFDADPNGKSFTLREGRNTIGRDADNDCRVDDPKMSSRHATVQHRAGRTWLYDENSNNGTFLNDEDIFQDRPALVDGSVLRLGATRFIVKLLDPAHVSAVFAPKGG
jgi:hypothetical protein